MKNETLSKFQNDLINNSLFNDDHKATKNGNVNDKSKGLLRMTSTRKSKKNYLDRGSILDTFLKKNHPDNIRKTMSKENPNNILNNIDEIKEGIKENEESENDNDNDNDKSEEKEDLKVSSKLKYSINFDDDDDDEDENGDNGADNRYSMGDSKLFAMLENGNENDEELKELKNLYFNGKDKSEEEKNKDEENKNESKLKEKEKEKEDKIIDKNIDKNKKKEKEKDKNKIKMEENQKTDRSNGDSIGKKKVSFNLDNLNDSSNLKISPLANKENEKNNKNKDNNNEMGFGRIRLDSELEINLQDDIDGKYKFNFYDKYTNYFNDKEPVSKLKLDTFVINDIPLDINNINNKMINKYIYTFKKGNKPVKKINILHSKVNSISYINNIFMKKNKNNIKKEIIKEVIKEIPIQNIQNTKRLTNSSNNSRKKLINKENEKKIVPIKKQQGTQTKFIDLINDIYFQKEIKEYQIKQLLKYIRKVKQSNFCIKSKPKKFDENIFNEKYINNSIIDDIKKNKYATRTEIIDKNGIPINNNKYFYNKATYDKKNNLILSTRQNLKNKKNFHSNNKYYSSSTDKKINDSNPLKEFNLTNINNSLDKINQDSVEKNKNKYLNPQNMKLTFPEKNNKTREFYLNNSKNNNSNVINLTVDKNKFYPKRYKKYDLNKELYLVDELSTSEDKINLKNSTDFKDKEIKNEYIINRQDLLEKIHKVNQFLNTSDVNNINSLIKKKFKSSTLFDKNKYNSLIQNNKPKIKHIDIDIHQKLKTMNNQYNIDDDNSDNSMIRTKLLDKGKKPTSPFKEEDIISDNKKNIYNTNIFKGKNKRVNHYANNSFSFAENNFLKNRKSESIGYDLSNFLNNELNNLTYNKDKRNLENNNNKIFPSYNKKRLGLYKKYDESNYSSIYNNDINIENKKKGIGTLPLRKYISDLQDYENIFLLNHNKSID